MNTLQKLDMVKTAQIQAKILLGYVTFGAFFFAFLLSNINTVFGQVPGYSYRVKITIDGSQVCGSSNLINFPILVQHTAPFLRPAPTGLISNTNGYDIVFTTSDGSTLLNHQIDHYTYNATDGTYAAWVNIPSLAQGTNTDIYMYYGNSSVVANTSSTGTWDSNYRTIYHLQSSSFSDATANSINSTNFGTTTFATSKIGEGRGFDGNDYIQTNSNDLQTANNFTVSAWFNADATSVSHILWQGRSSENGWGDGGAVNSTSGQEMNLSVGTCCLPPSGNAQGGYLSAYLGHTEEQVDINGLTSESAFTDLTNWHYVVATYSNLNTSPQVSLYLDGALIDTDNGTTAANAVARNLWDTNLRIGRPGANQRQFDGQMDEVRISNIARTADWQCTEYNNQNNPGSGLTLTNDPPDLASIEGTTLNYTEGNPATIITSTTTVADENDGFLTSATVQITVNYNSGEDVLAFTNAFGITGSWNAATGVLTLSGTATLSNYQSALRSVTYTNTNAINPSSLTRTVSFWVNDGTSNSNIVTRNIAIIPANDAPTAVNDSYVVNEDTPLNVSASGILANDSDPEGTALTAVLVATTSNGSLTLNANGSFAYTPNANYSGSDSFTYRANDGSLNSSIATVTITITPVNDAPAAVNDSYTVNEDTPLNVSAPGVLTNDSDAEGSAVTTVLVSPTSNGTLTLNANGSFAYTPNTNHNGSDSFTYRANDGTLNSGIATVTITITPVNDAPTAVNDTYTINEDTPLNVSAPGVLTNDSDADANPITAVLVSTTSNGSLTLSANGSFAYTPNANFSGSDNFTYRSSDGTLNSGIATVTITIAAINDAPTAANDTYTVNEDTPLNITAAGVLTNDSDVDANPITAVLVSTTSNGSLTLNANGSFAYTPNANYSGSDSFTYRANDGTLNSGIATVTITITPANDAPVAVNDTYTVNEDTPLNITATGILSNDSDVDANPLTAVLVSTTSNGTLTLNANGSFAYTPNTNYSGSDSFTYRSSDGTLNSGIATVTITITPINDAPIVANDTYTVNEDTPLNIVAAGVLTNDSDIDGNPLTAVLVSTTSNGSLTLNANGSFAYTPNANYNGSDSFTYRANDGTLNSAIATVTITITPLNDAPVAVNDTYTVNEDTPLNVAAVGILSNDSDADANPLTTVLVSTTSNGTLTLNANGSFTYTPNANYNGSDSFTYRVNDGTLNSGVATVTITITPINDAPVAVNDTYTVNEDTPLNVAAPGILSNDSDADANPITAVLVSTTSNGSLTLNANGSFAYTPNANYNGSDSFTYRANDGSLNSNVATVNITITPVNDAPAAANDSYAINEDTPLNVTAPGVLSNDSDLEANPITAVLISTTSNGTLTLNANGSFAYIPNTNYNGSDSFTYRANDGTLNSGIATVTITITPVNNAPVATIDTYTANEDTPLNIAAAGVLTNDSDVDGNPLTAVLVSTTSNGSLTLNANGSFTYAPNADYNGSDSFTYRANDGTVNSGLATVTITITPSNDAPVAVNDTYTVNEDTPLNIAASGVLTNDSDVDGNPITAVLVSTTSNGSLTLSSNGSFAYTPNTNYNGSDSFTYRSSDGTLNSGIATVTITITPVNNAPVATNDTYTVNEDTPLNIAATGILSNDSDVDANPLTAVLVSTASNGTLTLNANGSFTYAPNADYNGSDSFTYRANDGSLNSSIATVNITITPVNDAPAAVNDSYAVNEDTPLNVTAPGVLSNDSDLEANPLTAVLLSTASNGTLTLNANGSFAYTPNPNYSGSDSFTYRSSDGTLNSGIATVTITTTPVNDTPAAVNDTYTVNEDTPLNIAAPGVLNNDSDVDGNPITAVLVSTTSNGSLTLSSNGSFAYTPNTNYNGSDSFTYRSSDGTLNSGIATVTITITPVNDAPTAVNNTYTINEDTPLNIAASGVLTNDTDVEANPLTAVLVSTASNGTLTLNANGSFTYAPNADYNGSDSFTYRANDGTLNSGIATVTITITPVNDAPAVVNDTYTVNEDTPLNIAALGVLTNDSDVDTNPLTTVLVSTTSNGTLTLNTNGSFAYTPNANYNGSDSFTYRANDGTLNSAIATVTITITPANDAPVAVNDTYAVNEDTPLNIVAPGILSNDSDADANPLTAVMVTPTSNGSLILNANGSFTYTPNSNYNGSDSFTYRANDGTLNSGIATVTITITPVNNAPVAVTDTYTVTEDTPLNVAAPGILSNDSDVDANPLTAMLVSTTSNGTLTLNTNGSFTYTPNANYNGSDSFTYNANDGTLNSGITTVTITITPVNDVPVAVNDTYTVNEDATLSVGTPGILNNDSDQDGSILTVILVGTTTNGTLALNPDGGFTYVPASDFNGSDSFTYHANDGMTNSSTTTVTLTVTPVNDAPIAANEAVVTTEDTPVSIDMLNNVTDNDNTLNGNSITILSSPLNGVTSINTTTGFVTYTPNTDFSGNDSFTYVVNDTDGGTSNSATVTITVTPVNDAPIAADDNATTIESSSVIINLLPNDSDEENNLDPTTVTIIGNVSNGSLTINPSNGVVTYTPANGFLGNDSFTYTINDADGSTSNVAVVTIVVSPINDPPVANDDGPITYAGGLPLAIDVLANDSDPDNTSDELTIVSVTAPTFGSVSIENGLVVYEPSGTSSGTVTFTYTIQDPEGLTSTATVTIQYEYVSLKISEGFSPNGDGRNDTWYIRSIESHPNNAVKVFDRWGLLVFETKQYDNASVVWDGRANTGTQSGNYLDQGTYYYIVDLGDRTKELSGYVMIVR